jgi:hypothetical protein
MNLLSGRHRRRKLDPRGLKTVDLYLSGDKTHIDILFIDVKTNAVEYENKRFWTKPAVYELRFLIKKILNELSPLLFLCGKLTTCTDDLCFPQMIISRI